MRKLSLIVLAFVVTMSGITLAQRPSEPTSNAASIVTTTGERRRILR